MREMAEILVKSSQEAPDKRWRHSRGDPQPGGVDELDGALST